MHGGRQLRMQRYAVESAESGEGLHAGGHFINRVGVHGARATIVPGVERGKQLHHLRAADFADDDAVRAHA